MRVIGTIDRGPCLRSRGRNAPNPQWVKTFRARGIDCKRLVRVIFKVGLLLNHQQSMAAGTPRFFAKEASSAMLVQYLVRDHPALLFSPLLTWFPTMAEYYMSWAISRLPRLESCEGLEKLCNW